VGVDHKTVGHYIAEREAGGGEWRRWDYGEGPPIDARRTSLFCAWLAWSRYRILLPLADHTLPSVVMALDRTLRAVGSSPIYAPHNCRYADIGMILVMSCGALCRVGSELPSRRRRSRVSCRHSHDVSRNVRSVSGGL
jgi:hypothetical protein